MNGRFKFRAWDEGKMVYDVVPADGEIWKIIGMSGEHNILYEDEKIMQCTSLKDKNGKLIFEGDIVKIQGDCGEENVNVWWGDAYGSWMCLVCMHEDQELNLYNEEAEIIGNIYENPELLNQ